MLGTEWIWQLKDMATQPLGVIFQGLERVDAAAVEAEQHIGAIGANDYGFGNLELNLGVTRTKTDEVSDAANRMDGIFKTAIAGAASFFAAQKFVQMGGEIYDTGTKLETLNNVINYTSKDAADAAANHEFLHRIIDDYRLPLMETTDGFSQMNAALMGSKLAGQDARDIFEGVSIAATAMHLDAAKTNQVFTALNQMVSKGTVQAQELKLQLGNALPGSFQLAAQAMGMTTQEFTKQVEAGNVYAEDFLPKFAAILKAKFEGAIPAALASTIAKMTAFKNESIKAFDEIFKTVQPIVNTLIDAGTTTLSAMRELFGFINEHKDVIEAVGVSAGVAAIGWGLLNTELIITEGLWLAGAAAIGVANAALAINAMLTKMTPLGWFVTIVSALAGVVYWAFQNVGWFREGLYGLWEVVKVIGDAFVGLGKVIWGALTFDAAMFSQGVATLANVGYDAGLAWAEGLREGKLDGDKDGEEVSDWDAKVSAGLGTNAASVNSKSVVTAENTASNGGKETTMKGDSAAKIINVRIENLGKEIIVNAAGGVREGAREIRRIIHEELIAAVRDFEIGISND